MKKIGILGAGQLAMMLAEAAKKLGHQPIILAESETVPAAASGADIYIGSLESEEDLREFFRVCDVVTIESEFVNTSLIEKAVSSLERKTQLLPTVRSIRVAQDKLAQKELFLRQHLPTARHRYIFGENLESELKELLEDFSDGVVLKWAKFGYDGKGNFVLSHESQIAAALEFCKKAHDRGVRVYAEEKIQFLQELAIVVTRERSGRTIHYPLVTSKQEDGICRLVQGPAIQLGVPLSLEREAFQLAQAIGETLQLVGTFAIEFFQTSKGLLINEMAPRVHNSGHYSQMACDSSQFENHILAITGAEVNVPHTARFFGMLNIIGKGATKDLGPIGQKAECPPDVQLVWYNKTEWRTGRKMGHINFVATSPAALQSVIQRAREFEQELLQSLGIGTNG